MTPSSKIYRNPDYLKLAKGKPCALCGDADGTVVAAHFSGESAHLLGKGAGIKASDHAVAFLCHICHGQMDTHSGNYTKIQRSATFLMAILQTQQMLLETGELEWVVK